MTREQWQSVVQELWQQAGHEDDGQLGVEERWMRFNGAVEEVMAAARRRLGPCADERSAVRYRPKGSVVQFQRCEASVLRAR